MDTVYLLRTFVTAVIVFVVGYLLFSRFQSTFAEKTVSFKAKASPSSLSIHPLPCCRFLPNAILLSFTSLDQFQLLVTFIIGR